MTTLHVMVGLPGAGKTTRARQLAADSPALRLTPDEWMVPLFGGSQPEGRRDVLEGRLVSLALQALRLGVDVVLDFGLWGRDERHALHQLALDTGAGFSMEYLTVATDVQWERVTRRWGSTPHETFPMSRAELHGWRAQFEEPDAAELAGSPPPPPPVGWGSWAGWAADRWPSLTLG